MVWYSHLFKNFQQFLVFHTVKGFPVVNEAKVDVSLEFLCSLHDQMNVCNLISGSTIFKIQLVHLEVLSSCTVEA